MPNRPMLLDSKNGAAHDLCGVPSKTLFIASSPRTGSTLLCRLLWSTGEVGRPKEYLNPMQVRDWSVRMGSPLQRIRHMPLRGPLLGLVGWSTWTESRRRAYLQAVMGHRSSANGWFGLKCHWHHFRAWFEEGGLDVESDLRVRQWVWIRRRDEIAQAVSWARALQTGQWASWQTPNRAPVYRPRQIQAALWRIRSQQRCWENVFERRGVQPQEVLYEDLTSSPSLWVVRILERCGLPPDLPVFPADLQPQTDDVNRAWIEQFGREGT